MDHERAEHLRKNLTGVCMILTPLCFLAGDALWPVTHTKAADVLADASGNTGRLAAGMVFSMVGFALMVGAIIGLAHMLHERRPVTAMVGGAMGLVGLLSVTAIVAVGGGVVYEAARGGQDTAAATRLVDSVLTGPVMIFGPITELLSLGMIVLAVGLARSRVVAMWSAVCLGVAAVGLGVFNPLAIKPLILLSEAVLLVALAPIGWMVMSESDVEWAETPEFHGFRPTMG